MPQVLTLIRLSTPTPTTELSSSPPGPYHQEPYVCKTEERFKAPPILPPHLLQVILNKDTGISVSSGLRTGPTPTWAWSLGAPIPFTASL